jgi:diguanylate cyclase (GGDEF)-like protein
MVQSSQPIRLLIVEDDPDQRELLRFTLEDRFGPAATVTDAESIADARTRDWNAFDLILSDFNLPDGTGMTLLEEVRRACNTPMILVTGQNVGQLAAEAIRKGATDYIVKVGDYLQAIPLVVEKSLVAARMRKENELLRSDLENALGELQKKNVALESSLKKVEEVAATDPLTGLYNRRHFGKVLSQLFSEAQRYDKDLSCVMIDLDGYKSVNDTCGHQVGDRLLVVASRAITANLRLMDVAARYGGDEFILLVPRAGGSEAAGIAERIRHDFRKSSALILRRNEGLTMSFGIASLQTDFPGTSEQLVAAADAALYQAKQTGRDRIVVSSPVVGH